MPNEPIQGGQEGVEGWPVPSISLPALEHQRVEGRGAVVWGRETILVCHSLHDLQGVGGRGRGSEREKRRERHYTCTVSRADWMRSLV